MTDEWMPGYFGSFDMSTPYCHRYGSAGGFAAQQRHDASVFMTDITTFTIVIHP